MTKIYVVTAGSYSDYGIKKVFLKKGRAEDYIEKYNKVNDYEQARIEEFIASDELVVENCNYVELTAKKSLGKDEIIYDFNYELDITDNEFGEAETYFEVSKSPTPYSEITLKRRIDNDYDETDIEKKYQKVAQDMFFILESNFEELISCEYGSELHIDTGKMLENKFQ